MIMYINDIVFSLIKGLSDKNTTVKVNLNIFVINTTAKHWKHRYSQSFGRLVQLQTD